ncbi:MAG: DUF4440 domain-containing protein [Flavobacteriaceae bacterium]|nr:DUF4440 domain-containing protein [Flavobacteriaceae bacterium]
MSTTKNLTLVFTLIFLAFSIIACEKKVVASPTAEQLGQMNRDFAKALKAGDAEAAANLYDLNASLLPPNEPIVRGREHIKAYWQGAIDAGILEASVKTISAGSDGDLAYEIGTFELKFKAENDSVIIETGKYTEILHRNSEGKWISLYGMWNANE